jgi:hypothetical protein
MWIASSCWRNSISKMVIKSVVVQTLEEFYFFKEPRLQSRLQARLDELNKQEFPKASSAMSSEHRPDTYVFLSNDIY